VELLNLSISGAVSGAVYSLLAIGLVLSYSTSRIFNFGHAATAFASAYMYYQLHVALGWSKGWTLVVVLLVFAPVMGWVWDKLVFSRLSGAAESTKIVAGVGVLIVVPALVVWVFNTLRDVADVGFVDTAEVYQVPGILPARQYKLGEGLIVSNDQVLALAASIVLFLLLWGLLRFTRLGLQMRMAVDSPSLAALRGINTSKVSKLSWLMSFFMAGVAGILAAPFPGPFGLVNDNYTLALFVAATAAVVAGLRSIPIAFAAGLSLGALRNLVAAYVNGDYLGVIGEKIAGVYGLTSSVPYIALLIALIVVGHDHKRRKAGTTGSGPAPVPDYQADLTRFQRALPLLLRGAVFLVIGLFFANGIWTQLFIVGLATGIIFMSFTVVTGLGGMVSLAQGTFATAAALTAGLLIDHGSPFVVAVLGGMAAAGVLGALTALPALRLNGLMLTFATLALALLGTGVLFKIEWFANGTLGWKIARPHVGPLDLADDHVMLVVYFCVMLAVAWLVSNLQKSASGRAMIAVRTAEPAAAASAVSPADNEAAGLRDLGDHRRTGRHPARHRARDRPGHGQPAAGELPVARRGRPARSQPAVQRDRGRHRRLRHAPDHRQGLSHRRIRMERHFR
jgi:branched-subunit amino acid ABC-type transport system permease component